MKDKNNKNKKEKKILRQIKLKYFTIPQNGQDNFICFQCKKRSTKIGSGNVRVSPPEIRCENCAIKNYAVEEGLDSFSVAASRRRRIFDISYLFQEMVIDRILKEEDKTYKNLSGEEYERAIEIASEMWNDNRVISKEEKWYIEETPSQKEIEEVFNEILDGISLHRVEVLK